MQTTRTDIVQPQSTLLDFLLRRKRFASDVLLKPMETDKSEEETSPPSDQCDIINKWD